MKTKLLLLTAIFYMLSGWVLAQDTMYLRNKEVMTVKIVELGLNEVKYKMAPYLLETPVRSIEKYKVEKIVLESGEEIVFAANPIFDDQNFVDQRRRAIKVNFFSPLNATLFLAYEQSVKPGQSWEVELGFIGAGFDLNESRPRGAAVRLGYKFIRTPDYVIPGMRLSHILNGGYIKPEFVFSAYQYNDEVFNFNSSFTSDGRTNVNGGAILLNLGKQWIFSDRVALDTFFALGYAFTNDGQFIQYGFFGGESSFPLAFTGGLRLGYLLK